MTLEDFFTLTEMKDGLTASSRVEELLSIMSKEKDGVVKNVGDATRQWAAVASTIAATENQDCLDLFIQLDGLSFIDRWLKEAQKFSNNTNGSFVEDSIVDLLKALEKLQISNEKSITSGIWITVRNLLGNSSSRIQDRARAVFDGWKLSLDADAVHHDVENTGVPFDKTNPRCASEDGQPCGSNIPIFQKGTSEENPTSESALDETSSSRISDGLQPGGVENLKGQSPRNEHHPHLILVNSDVKDISPSLPSAVVSKPECENVSVKEEAPKNFNAGTTTSGFAVSKLDSAEEESDQSKLNEFPKHEKQLHKVDGSSVVKLGVTEISSASSIVEAEAVSSAVDAANAQESAKQEPIVQNNDKASEAGVSQNVTAVDSGRTPSDSKCRMDDLAVSNCSTTQVFTAGQDGESYLNVLQDSSNNRSKVVETSFAMMDEIESLDKDKESSSDASEAPIAYSAFSKPKPCKIEKGSDMELEDGIIDALEVARQVAQEVEREVVDDREPFCSSSSEKIIGIIARLGSPDSINWKQDQGTNIQSKEPPTARSHSVEGSSNADASSSSLDNVDGEPRDLHSVGSSKVNNEADQEAEAHTEKGFCGFDLNQELHSDEMDVFENPVSTPMPVFPVSRPDANPGLALAPLQFDDTVGWKGSATTSALCPAPALKITDGDKTLSADENSDGSKQRHAFIGIDLNVTKFVDELGKHHPLEGGLKRSGGLNFDLNCIGDEGDATTSDQRTDGNLFHNQNSHFGPAYLSSPVQPLMRNIDLNEGPQIQNSSSEQDSRNVNQDLNVHGGSKADASVISIMGTKVEVNRNGFALRTASLSSGNAIEPAMDVYSMSSALSNKQPFFGYNGPITGATPSFPSMVYAPGSTIPRMVDPRRATVVPPIMGSASAVPFPPSSYSHTPFFMSINGSSQLALGGPTLSRPNFDLNSPFMIDGANRELGGLRQFLAPGHGRSMEEQLRSDAQVPSSGYGVKRKEPDGGWEPHYTFGYKDEQPPCKQ